MSSGSAAGRTPRWPPRSVWCLQHSGRIGHEGFRCEISTHWRVFPGEGATQPRALSEMGCRRGLLGL
ncbi:DUF7848 domain-containing protein [Streptomyces sp.]